MKPLVVTYSHHHSRIIRSGFTLVELLVVVTIITIILAMTVSAVKFTTAADRVSGAAGQLQSFLAGARDRAIYSKEPRGVRLFIEPAPPGSATGAESRTIASAAYIAPGGTWSAPVNSGSVDIMRIDGNILNSPSPPVGQTAADGDFEDTADRLIKVRGSNNPGWWNLKRRGWLVDGLRMRIPAGPTGNWYSVNTALIDTSVAPPDDQFLLLDIPYADPGNLGQEIAITDQTYEIELPPRILPQDPMILPEGVVIDLDGSSVPDVWRPTATGNGSYGGYMDIVFSPRGSIIGAAAAKGVLHLYICDSEDSLFLKEQFVAAMPGANQAAKRNNFDAAVFSNAPFIPLDEIDPTTVNWLSGTRNYIPKDRRLVTVFTQTGGISVHHVNSYIGVGGSVIVDQFDPFDIDNDGYRGPVVSGDPAEPDGLCDDPYRFAETGEVAK